MESGIYKITNTVTKQIYVGQSVHVIRRIKTHLSKLIAGAHPNKHMQASFNKYGAGAFTYNVIERVAKEQLTERETYWVKRYKSINPKYGFNRMLPTDNYTTGLNNTAADKTKYSFTNLDGTHEPNITIIELVHKYQISDSSPFHRMVRGELEVVYGWFIKEPTSPWYQFVELWHKDGSYIRERRVTLNKMYPEIAQTTITGGRIGDWFTSKEERDKRVKTVMHKSGKVLRNALQRDFVCETGCSVAGASNLWNGNVHSLKGWFIIS